MISLTKIKDRLSRIIFIFAVILIEILMVDMVKAADIGCKFEQIDATADSVTISYQMENVDEYIINFNYDVNGLCINTNSNTVRIENLRSGSKHVITITGYDQKKTRRICKSYNVYTLPDTQKKEDRGHSNLGDESNSTEFDWSFGNAIEGYEYKLCDYKGRIVDKGSIEDTSTVFSETAVDQIYNLKVRGYMTYKGKQYYTYWDKINYTGQAHVKSLGLKGNKLTVNWNKVKGAARYEVYVSDMPFHGYRLVKKAGSNATKATITKIGKKRVSSKQPYYVYIKTFSRDGESEINYYWSTKNKGKTSFKIRECKF